MEADFLMNGIVGKYIDPQDYEFYAWCEGDGFKTCIVELWSDDYKTEYDSTLGKDVFVMSIYTYNQGQRNYGKLMFTDLTLGSNYGDMSEEKMTNDCVNKGVTCGLFLQRNGWKFPKDYPIKF